MEADLLFRLVAFFVLIALSAGFSASETAFFSLGGYRVQGMRKEGGVGARIAALLKRPRRLIISILMGNEIVNIAASAVFAGAVVSFLGEGRSWLAVVLMTPILMVFGEITPKSVAARFPEGFARLLAAPLSHFAAFIRPFRAVVLWISNGVLILLGAPPQAKSNILMEDEFLTLVDAGHEEGELDAVEKAYIHNIFKFHDGTVREIQVPRTDMVCWEAGLPLAEAVNRVRSSPHSRIPIYRDDRDHIVGIAYVKDFLRLARRKSFDPSEMIPAKMLREPLFVPTGMKLEALFRLFRQKRTHIAIVADEFGGVSGLVTMEDLLEEIFGEIKDEFDAGEEAEAEKQADGSYLCLARIPLEAFRERTGWPLPGAMGANTLGGLVFHMLGQVPKVNEKVRVGNIELTVLEVRQTRVLRIRAERLGEAS